MHAPAELLLEFSKLSSHTLADRRASHRESPPPVLPTDMLKAQEIERLGFPFSSTFPVLFGEPTKLDPGASYPGEAPARTWPIALVSSPESDPHPFGTGIPRSCHQRI